MLKWLIALEISTILIIAAAILPGGEDLHKFYIPFAGGCLDCGYVPYFAQWLLWPLSLIPPQWAWSAMTAITCLGTLLICRITGANPAAIMMSFPFLAQIWLGQVDIIIAAGLVMVISTNPYLQGLGILMMMVKPQLTGLALITISPSMIKPSILATPVMALLASLIVFGPGWPVSWFTNATTLPMHAWRIASSDIWPVGLLFVWLPLLFRKDRLLVALLVSSVASPFYSIYSYFIFLIYRCPWWATVLSWTWLLYYPFLGRWGALRYAWVLPVVYLVILIKGGDLIGAKETKEKEEVWWLRWRNLRRWQRLWQWPEAWSQKS